MKTNKTYATLAGAYTAVEKAGAERFDLTYNGGVVLDILARTYKHKIKVTLAKWNLVRYENTLCALECTTTPDCKTTYKWTAVAKFDSDGQLYAVGTEAPKTEDKPKAKAPRKRAKGNNKSTATWQTDLDALAGKGRASNKKAASVLRRHKMSTQIGSEGWTYWESIR